MARGKEVSEVISTFLTALLSSSLILSMMMLLLLALFSVSSQWLTAKTRYIIWIILLIGLVIPFRPIVGSGLITLKNPLQISLPSDQTVSSDLLEEGSFKLESSETETVKESTLSIVDSGKQTKQRNFFSITHVLLLWMMGALLVFGKYMLEYRRFRQLTKRWSTPVLEKSVLAIFHQVKAEMGLENKHIHLMRCSGIQSPMLTGLKQPCVFLPDKDFCEEEMILIIKHELTHYKHKDLWVSLLSIIAICLHWFNPVLHLCLPVIRSEAEACCDEEVLRGENIDYRRFYGEVIISMIETNFMRQNLLSTCFYAKKFNIKRRLFTIMEMRKKRRNLSIASIIMVLCLTLVSGSVVVFATPTAKSYIGEKKAKAIALKDAKLKEAQVKFVTVKLDKDDGRMIYDVEFYKGNKEYDYEIDAKTGKIIEKDFDIENYVIGAPLPKKPQPPANLKLIGEAKAKSIALNHAKLKETDVKFVKVQLDYDDGRWIYDVEFYRGNQEYDYEIDARNGKLLAIDFEIENGNVHTIVAPVVTAPAKNVLIDAEKAKDVALNHAGLKASDVNFVKVKQDYDDGRAIYEIEFYSRNQQREYDYEIDAVNGKVISWDSDYEHHMSDYHHGGHHFDHDDDFDTDYDD